MIEISKIQQTVVVTAGGQSITLETRGPPGPAGPAGPQGPVGDADSDLPDFTLLFDNALI
jgi:hypothetical protein